MAQLYIAPLLPRFMALQPGVQRQLWRSDTPVNLITGGVDLGLRAAALDDSSLTCRKLADDRRVRCASPGYLAEHAMPPRPGCGAGSP